MKPRLDNMCAHNVPLDLVPEPFLFDLNWSALALIDALSGTGSPPYRFGFTRSANDPVAHRPQRRKVFLAMPPLPSRFRIGG